MDDYWKRVSYRARSEAAVLLGVDSREKIVIKGILAVAIILALALFGSEDASRDEMIVRFTIIAVFVLLILLVYAWKFADSPPRMESEAAAEASAKISSLQERITALESKNEASDLAVWKPSPDAAAPSGPSGIYREIKLTR